MTLRQDYARPCPRAIARHPGPGAQLPQQPSQLTAGCAHRRARPATLPQPRACHRLDPRGVATQIRPLQLFPAARARRAERPLQPAPGTAGARHRRPAPRPALLEPHPAGCYCR
jgi:hypothetical protein